MQTRMATVCERCNHTEHGQRTGRVIHTKDYCLRCKKACEFLAVTKEMTFMADMVDEEDRIVVDGYEKIQPGHPEYERMVIYKANSLFFCDAVAHPYDQPNVGCPNPDCFRNEDKAVNHSPDAPEHLRGDGPCGDCGGHNAVWFTDNIIWNAVMRDDQKFGSQRPEPLMCFHCFVKRAEDAGMRPTGWRIMPEWPQVWVAAQDAPDA